MYSKEFYSELCEIEKEFYENKLFLETIHPSDLINNRDQILLEASEKGFSLGNAIEKIKKLIQEATEKFIAMTNKLVSRNAQLIKKYESIDPNKINIKDNFSYEMLPYWEGMRRIQSYSTPDFNDQDIGALTANSGLNYKAEKFNNHKGLFDEKNNYAINPDYFKGGSQKQEINKSNAAQVFNSCLNILRERKQITDKIRNENGKIIKLRIGSSIALKTIGESALFDMSIFKDEYSDILYESIESLFEDGKLDDGITTTSEIEREDKQAESGGIDINKEENDKVKGAKYSIEAAKNWANICYDINAKIMSALDEAYDQSIKYCEKFSNL